MTGASDDSDFGPPFPTAEYVERLEKVKAAMAALPAAARKEAAAFLKRWVMQEIPALGPGWAARYAEQLDEEVVLEQASNFLAATFGCEVAVAPAGDATGGAAGKARQAAPLRPAIFVK